MGGTLTKDELVERMQMRLGFSLAEARDLLELLLETMKATLEAGTEIKVSGFGRWRILLKAPRRGRNPATGEEIALPARRVVAFHASDRLREKVSGVSP